MIEITVRKYNWMVINENCSIDEKYSIVDVVWDLQRTLINKSPLITLCLVNQSSSNPIIWVRPMCTPAFIEACQRCFLIGALIARVRSR